MSHALTLVQVQPRSDRDLAKLRRDKATANLREAFQTALADLGWSASLEAIAAELDAHRDEAQRWDRDVWVQRSKAIIELAEDGDLK